MLELNKLLIPVCVILLCNDIILTSLTVSSKPTFSLSLIGQLSRLTGFSKRDTDKAEDINSRVKPFSGQRVKGDSIQMVYYHDQTIAVIEIGPDRLLLNCELIEVIEPNDANATLYNLKSISKPLVITLDEMLNLLKQCEMLEEPSGGTSDIQSDSPYTADNNMPPKVQQQSNSNPIFKLFNRNSNNGATQNPSATFSVLNGIAPGTKWCGSGDIAVNYHDLGTDANVDKCCRTHDICPVKIAKYATRYTLYNDSPFTRSYCQCDDMLYSCLKQANSTSGQLFGNIFFNLVQTTCIDKTNDGKWLFRKNKKQF
ncbi:uncharacterized protein LOC123294006 [Chrysoperla carnea]|uniref:uncharacterized protein LOC123294006 n=1 Tax=Chrysoperla carnea TaxID=189513 RepID=UPI001D05C517|nr:uncharacterized protein LOC123294006 [Chrysoperla carnea]